MIEKKSYIFGAIFFLDTKIQMQEISCLLKLQLNNGSY